MKVNTTVEMSRMRDRLFIESIAAYDMSERLVDSQTVSDTVRHTNCEADGLRLCFDWFANRNQTVI